MNELFLYDRDNGLFKEVLKQSTVIEGRYHVAPGYGHELNTGNLEAFIKDPKTGLSDEKQKYPICVCMVPRSTIVQRNGSDWEYFYFNMFFLCTTYYTGQNKVKQPDPGSGISTHHVWYDWKDMQECARNFLTVLDEVVRNKTVVENEIERPMATVFHRDHTMVVDIKRLTKFNNDRLSGVSVLFNLYLDASVCSFQDYPADVLDKISIPELNPHPLHKH